MIFENTYEAIIDEEILNEDKWGVI